LDSLVSAGKVRYLGNSNFSGWQIADADWTARSGQLTPFVSAQNQYNLLSRDAETEVIPACQRFGLGLLPFFPLASGLLTGKYRRAEPPPPGTRLAGDAYRERLASAPWDRVEALQAFAQARGLTLLDVAIGGLAAMGGAPTVGPGASGSTAAMGGAPTVGPGASGSTAAMGGVASVIAGATTPEQVAANVAAARWIPTPEDLAELNRIR
jgi:aryl-alcohol dehydrogenase-like predicted oxidoreductase